MIQKYTYGTPFETDAIVTSIPASEGAPAYGTTDTCQVQSKISYPPQSKEK